MNIQQLLEKNAKLHPKKAALIFNEEAISFRSLKEDSFRLAHALLKLGVQKGERVAIYLPNAPQYVYSYLAIWSVGATSVPLDFMLTEDELVSCITHAEAKILIAKSKPHTSLKALKERCPSLREIICCDEHAQDFPTLKEILADSSITAPAVTMSERDYAIIFYTSGTTGKPKGVLINYKQLEAPVKAIGYFVEDLRKEDITMSALPFSHLGGLIFIQVLLEYGTTVVLMERFAPAEFLKNISRYRVNWFWLVPSMYYAFLHLKEFDTFDLSMLRWIVIFGAPSSADAVRRFLNRCPRAVLYHGWGLTETNAPTTVIPTGSEKIESVGKPPPWVEVKIFDDNDAELSGGSVGEIVVKGWVVTDGYYKDSALTEQTVRGGWFHTGDLGRIDAEGYLYIVGRKKEMIKVAGEIVFEPEVEATLHKHPDVVEAAVIGVADSLRGEVPKAIVVLKEGSVLSEEDLRYFCREHLAHFKIPHHFEFRTALPKNRTGKIDKEALRK
jgi:long-chain acyl-CoA synthetase